LTLFCFTDRINNMESKNEISSYLSAISVFLLGLLFLAFPILITTITTDIFTIPKQFLLGAVVLILLSIFVIRMIIEGSVKLRRTFLDLPIILFSLMLFLSALFAVNRFDSIIAFVPILFAVFSFFVIVNIIRDNKSILPLILSLLLGGVILSTLSILSFFKIHLIPLIIAQSQIFTPIGSLLDQAVYLAILLPIALYFTRSSTANDPSGNNSVKSLIFITISIVILMGLLFNVYQIFNPPTPGQKLIILPYKIGLQTAFASISQDTNRFVQGFFFGSGFGTFATDFTRFKQAAFNQNQTLWNLTFVKSSSFILELLATTGFLGLLSFVFLIIRGGKVVIAGSNKFVNPFSISLVLAIAALIILPVGFTIQAIFFILLGLFAVVQSLIKADHKKFFDIELQIVALKKGLFNVEALSSTPSITPQHHLRHDTSKILPVIFAIIIFIIVGFLGFFSTSYLISDIKFQSALIAASKNKATETYQNQAQAISIFPYRENYYRIFSQTNLSLANSLASSQPKDASPSASDQQRIYRLIQQSINAARTSTTLSPQTSINWQNLSSIYRSLIGFGQNSESFAIATQQQALILDPNNPQQYILLGGIYYQLGRWENAQTQFQIAVNLKSDFANAHYNLGHALENKGDLDKALAQYEIVKGLVSTDQNSLKQITSEIEVIKSKIEGKVTAVIPEVPPLIAPPLNVSTPSAQLPPQNPPVEIPPPTEATKSAQ